MEYSPAIQNHGLNFFRYHYIIKLDHPNRGQWFAYDEGRLNVDVVNLNFTLQSFFDMWCVARYGSICGNVKNTHGGVLLLVKLQANFTKINTPPWVFFTFFKLYKSYDTAQSFTYIACTTSNLSFMNSSTHELTVKSSGWNMYFVLFGTQATNICVLLPTKLWLLWTFDYEKHPRWVKLEF